MPSHPRLSGFTLIELLVVISIIDSFINTIRQMLVKVKESGRVTSPNMCCKNNSIGYRKYSSIAEMDDKVQYHESDYTIYDFHNWNTEFMVNKPHE